MPDGDTIEYPPLEERPLITFALFAFNQEKYIKEAVQSAFLQTYSPLEIILSDDCSTDSTYTIMEQLLSRYSGPHKVILNRNIKNLGLIEHVNLINKLSRGDLIIAAAGDDISFPERTSITASIFIAKNKPMLIHGRAIGIDKQGKFTGDYFPDDAPIKYISAGESYHLLALYVGATGAWNRNLAIKYGPIVERDTYEDLVIGFRAALEGKICFIDQNLIKYRIHHESISRARQKTFKDSRLSLSKIAIATLRQRINDTIRSSHPQANELQRNINIEIIRWEIIKSIYKIHGKKLLSFLLNHPKILISAAYGEISAFKWSLRFKND
jgi:glycosyltransferase involved in cell wall biosynthesis